MKRLFLCGAERLTLGEGWLKAGAVLLELLEIVIGRSFSQSQRLHVRVAGTFTLGV